jgi:hypothetical protein
MSGSYFPLSGTERRQLRTDVVTGSTEPNLQSVHPDVIRAVLESHAAAAAAAARFPLGRVGEDADDEDGGVDGGAEHADQEYAGGFRSGPEQGPATERERVPISDDDTGYIPSADDGGEVGAFSPSAASLVRALPSLRPMRRGVASPAGAAQRPQSEQAPRRRRDSRYRGLTFAASGVDAEMSPPRGAAVVVAAAAPVAADRREDSWPTAAAHTDAHAVPRHGRRAVSAVHSTRANASAAATLTPLPAREQSVHASPAAWLEGDRDAPPAAGAAASVHDSVRAEGNEWHLHSMRALPWARTDVGASASPSQPAPRGSTGDDTGGSWALGPAELALAAQASNAAAAAAEDALRSSWMPLPDRATRARQACAPRLRHYPRPVPMPAQTSRRSRGTGTGSLRLTRRPATGCRRDA